MLVDFILYDNFMTFKNIAKKCTVTIALVVIIDTRCWSPFGIIITKLF